MIILLSRHRTIDHGAGVVGFVAAAYSFATWFSWPWSLWWWLSKEEAYNNTEVDGKKEVINEEDKKAGNKKKDDNEDEKDMVDNREDVVDNTEGEGAEDNETGRKLGSVMSTFLPLACFMSYLLISSSSLLRLGRRRRPTARR